MIVTFQRVDHEKEVGKDGIFVEGAEKHDIQTYLSSQTTHQTDYSTSPPAIDKTGRSIAGNFDPMISPNANDLRPLSGASSQAHQHRLFNSFDIYSRGRRSITRVRMLSVSVAYQRRKKGKKE